MLKLVEPVGAVLDGDICIPMTISFPTAMVIGAVSEFPFVSVYATEIVPTDVERSVLKLVPMM